MRIVDNTKLTKRESEVVLLLLSGKNKQYIAKKLFLSLSTIKANVENIYRKFNVHNKAELIIYVLKNKIVEFDEND